MTKRSDNFSLAVVRLLRDRVNGQCSNPDCGRATVGPSKELPNKSVVTGEAAHIKAASPGGPRYDGNQSAEERSSIENGMWLCGACAGLIDKNNGADYTVETLLAWKRMAEDKAFRAQAVPATALEAPWDSGFAAISYMNVPRLGMWAAGRGMRINAGALNNVANLHDLGWNLNHLMFEVEKALKHLTIRAVPIDRLTEVEQDFTGATVSFDRQFFTKNGPEIPSGGQTARRVPSDWNKAPHIHCKLGKWRFVVVYDPKWMTTTTAYVEFRGGSRRFKGIGIVKEVNRDEQLVIVSPLFIGFPKPAFDMFG